MLFKIRKLDLIAGKSIVVLNKKDSERLEVEESQKVNLNYKNKTFSAIVNLTSNLVKEGEIGIYLDVFRANNLKENDLIEVEKSKESKSTVYIKSKIYGKRLSYNEIYQIVKDTVDGLLSDIELTALVTALNSHGLTVEEAANFAIAMVETGKTLNLKSKIILDKHSIGGLSGDKTSLLLVPIIASLGYKIPKTSSRAITSAAGTADKASVLMNVELDVNEMEYVVNKANGCLVWGGSLHLAPADDIFIRYEYPLGIDPLMLASIMAKKKAVNATHLVIDIPTGRGTKVKTIGEAEELAKDFIEISKILKIKTKVLITQGIQPMGFTIGPALEAKEVLEILMRRKSVLDVVDKVLNVADSLLKLVGTENGYNLAKNCLFSGKAEIKMRQLIELQNGNKGIKPEDIEIASSYYDFISSKDGSILWLDTNGLNEVARALGCPKDKKAGIQLFKKVGNKVKKGEKILRLYSSKSSKLESAAKLLEENSSIGIGKSYNILIKSLEEVEVPRRTFILER